VLGSIQFDSTAIQLNNDTINSVMQYVCSALKSEDTEALVAPG